MSGTPQAIHFFSCTACWPLQVGPQVFAAFSQANSSLLFPAELAGARYPHAAMVDSMLQTLSVHKSFA